MQKFEMPAISVEEFEIVDVIMTASQEIDCPMDGLDCDSDTPIDW